MNDLPEDRPPTDVCGGTYPPGLPACPHPSQGHTGHPAASSTHGGVAFTGFNVGEALLVVALLVIVGLALVRRRRPA